MIKKFAVYFKGLYYTGVDWNSDVSCAWPYDTYDEANNVAKQLKATVLIIYV